MTFPLLISLKFIVHDNSCKIQYVYDFIVLLDLNLDLNFSNKEKNVLTVLYFIYAAWWWFLFINAILRQVLTVQLYVYYK